MSNMPSHATSSVNQVASAYSGNPQALQQRTQPQNGVTPELIDLLALQKLQAEKANAARQLAMANNQQMPTVAEGLEQNAMQSARSEIAQKLGLPALMNQGQNVAQAPQGAPQGQPQMPPQGPTVNAAQGGLMRIPSNLPQNYAGGGIIAFAGSDDAGQPTDQQVPNSNQQQLQSDRSAVVEGLKKFGYAAEDIAAMPFRAASALFNSLLIRPARAITNTEIPYFPMLGGEPGSLTPFTDRAYKEANPPTNAAPTGVVPSPAADKVAETVATAPVVPATPPKAPARPGTTTSAAPAYQPPPFPVARPGSEAMGTAVEKGLTAGMNIDPAKARTDAMTEYKAMFGAHQDAASAAQQKGLADLVAAQEAEKSGRPDKFLGIFNRAGLAALNPASLTPWAKVSGAVEEERQGFAKKDEANVIVRNTLTTAMHEAIAKNDASLYAAGKEAAVEALRAKGMALSDAVKYVDSQARTLEAAQANWQTNRTREQISADARADRAARSADASGLKEAQLEETARRNAEAAYNRDPMVQTKVKRMGMLDMMIQGSVSDPKKQAEFQAEQDKIARELAAIQGQYFNPRGMATPKDKAGWSATVVPPKS